MSGWQFDVVCGACILNSLSIIVLGWAVWRMTP